jgi:acetolactate synthase-1/2/3 large subunit
MVLLVGQIGREMRGREAFQEVDYRQTFRDLAKWVEEIDDPARIPELMAHAWHVALSGRPGPVVLALPEDMLREVAEEAPGPRVEVADPAPSPAAMVRFEAMLREAESPVMVLGGSRWTPEAVTLAERFAESWDIPVGTSFRRQMLFDNRHPNYAGDVGLGINPDLKKRLAESDLLILLGARFSENPSQNFTLLSIPQPAQRLVHVHPGPEEIGRIYTPDLPINATPGAFLEAAAALTPPTAARGRAAEAHASWEGWVQPPAPPPGEGVDLGAVVAHLSETCGEDAILCNGAGNYAVWLHRFYPFRRFGTQLAPTSGSMGYGLPAAVAAKLRHPEREVICLAGDGCFQMTMQEFGTAAQYGAGLILLVCDNGSYGTIRMHQERHYPGRVTATDIVNPDFAALAKAYGAHAETVHKSEDFAPALARAREAGGLALLHLKTNPEAITPTARLSALGRGG